MYPFRLLAVSPLRSPCVRASRTSSADSSCSLTNRFGSVTAACSAATRSLSSRSDCGTREFDAQGHDRECFQRRLLPTAAGERLSSSLGGFDGLVFAAGMGENNFDIRACLRLARRLGERCCRRHAGRAHQHARESSVHLGQSHHHRGFADRPACAVRRLHGLIGTKEGTVAQRQGSSRYRRHRARNCLGPRGPGRRYSFDVLG